jgi:4-hydroxy-tetrahydrodipicolinate synthase
MEKLTAATLKGNWATLLLPINPDNTINFQKLSGQIESLITVGVDGIYSNGTAGEFHNQTETEFDKINQLLAEKCNLAGMRFQIGASHPSPIISLERIKRSVALRPDALQIILPDWVAANPVEQIVFLQEIAANSNNIPLVLYNPPHAKTALEINQLQNLVNSVPQIIGVKLLSGDEHWMADMQQLAKQIAVFVPGHFLATGFKSGVASGSYSNVACINPKAAQMWWHLMQTDIEAALDIEQRILQFFKECIAPYQQKQYSNPALDKFLAAVGGFIKTGTRLRWPYQFITENDVFPVRKRAMQLIPEFF